MARTQSRGGRRPDHQSDDSGGNSNALTTTEAKTEWLRQVTQYVAGRRDQLAMLLGTTVDPERFITVALAAVQGSPQLLNCTPLSIFTAIREAATWGLELGPLGDASLVPYDGQAQLQVEYRGYRKLSMRDGSVRVVAADVVYTADQFRIVSGSESPGVYHEPALTNRGNVLGAYAWARLANGELVYVWMDEAELYKRRDVSKSWRTALKYNRTDSIWHLWPIEMMRKTVIKRLCSEQLPLTPLLREVMARDTDVDSMQPGDTKSQLPAGTLQGADARARILAAMGMDQPQAQLTDGQQPAQAPEQAGDATANAQPTDDSTSSQDDVSQDGAPDDEDPGPAPTAPVKACGQANPYGGTGGPCVAPAGHSGHHRSADKESW